MSDDNTVSAVSWHARSAEDTAAGLDGTLGGLSESTAADRLKQYGPNELQSGGSVSPWELLLEQFKNVLIIILLLAAGLSFFLGHSVEAIAIGVIVLFAVFLGFVQEYKAERAIEALKKMAAPTATVIRGGQEVEVPAREVVPGDVIMIRPGNKIPADARLIDAVNLQIEEAALTGESLPVEKHSSVIPNENVPLGDRKNMVYAGTASTYGRGKAIVVATGMKTEFGKIAQMLQGVERSKTPLQVNLDKVGRSLAKAAFAVVGVIVVLGLMRGQPFIEMLIFGIALAVAVVPEALPAVVTISLAIGVQRMVKRNALMRRLPAVETLGSTSVICSDKTGTLTKDEMTARKIFTGEKTFEISGAGYEPKGVFTFNGTEVHPSGNLELFLRAGTLASDADIVFSDAEQRWRVKGDPTEGAIIVAAAKAGMEKPDLDSKYPRTGEIPFSSETKKMTTIHRGPEGPVSYSKGAPEVVLASCTKYMSASGETVLDAAAREELLDQARQMADQALRVIAVAGGKGSTQADAEKDMTLLGLIGMIDPPRPEAKAAIQKCEMAGIKPVMITGDHPVTAQAVARELGLLKGGMVVTGPQLDAMSDADFERDVEKIEVYARVSPAHKLKVVTALQNKGHAVAMTGDGVNDAPALKKADIGIAMGITGTDVTKEAAAMTLTDDNFASIVAAVEEGRGIFSNIKKYLMYLLSSNIGEIGLMTGATLAGLPLPLTAVQILYVNLATDGLPALALAVDPPEDDLMKRKPRNSRKGIFTRPVVTLMLVGGIWSTICNLGLFVWALKSGRLAAEAVTMTFVSLVLIQFFKAYNFRSDRNSVFHKPFANKWLNRAVVWELLLLVLIIYVPFLQKPFATFALTMTDWVIIIAISLTVSPVLELAKWMERRGLFGRMSD